MKYVVTYLTTEKNPHYLIDAPSERDALTIAWQAEKPGKRVYMNLYPVDGHVPNYPMLTDYDPSTPVYHPRHSYGRMIVTMEACRLGLDDGEPLGLGLFKCHETGERCYYRADGKLFTYPRGQLLIPKKKLEQMENLFRYIPIRVHARADGSFDREANMERWCCEPLVDWLEEQENK